MLKLDTLELIGFKSFPRKVRLQFNEAVTCLVGPNGCGKSNLSDAVGWVLGVHTAQSLRGQKMEDLIFGGTKKRKPSGFAEVLLSFSSDDGDSIPLAGLGISVGTLEISRKIYRFGESIYYLNGKRCRLKDVRNVLEDSGLGFASYALIAQGKIGWLLSAKSYERRVVIEEAAGISGYKSRRRQAELKLELAQQNLVRVNDIITEIERQLRSLKRQASKARRYEEVRQQFRDIQRLRFVLEAARLSEELGTLTEDWERLDAKIENLEKALSTSECELEAVLRERDRVEEELPGLRQEISSLQLKLERTGNTISHQEQQIESITHSLKNQNYEKEIIENSLCKATKEIVLLQSKDLKLSGEEKRIDSEFADQLAEVGQYETKIRETEDRVEKLRDQLFHSTSDVTALVNRKEQLEQRSLKAQAVQSRLETEKYSHSAKLTASSASLKDGRQDLLDKQSRIKDLKEQLGRKEKNKDNLARVLKRLADESISVNSRLIAQRERLQSLHEIEATHSQYSEGVQKLLNHLSSKSGIQTGGTLSDFIETSPEYEKIVESFLDEELEYILVDSLDEALRGVSEVKAIQSGRCTFLTLSSANGHTTNGDKPAVQLSPTDGVYGVLKDFVKVKPEIQEAFQRALPHRLQAIVVSDLDRAFKLSDTYPESTFITLEGESLTPTGLLSASSTQGRKLGLLSGRREKQKLENWILKLSKKLAELRKKEKKEKQSMQEILQFLKDKEFSRYELEKEMVVLVHKQERWNSEETRQRQALKVIAEELTQIEIQREEQGKEIQNIEQQLVRHTEVRKETENRFSKMQQLLEQQRINFVKMQERLHSIASDRKITGERRLALEQTIKRIQEQYNSLEEHQKRSLSSQVQMEERLEAIKVSVRNFEADLTRYQHKEKRIQKHIQGCQEEYMVRKQRIPKVERQLSDFRNDKIRLQEQRSSLDVQRARLETQLQSVSQQCWEGLQITLKQAEKELDVEEFDLAQTQQEYIRLKNSVEKFGPINLAALQEYQKSEQRFNFLTSQRRDVETSIVDTGEAIQEINRRSREKFKRAFKDINQKFIEVFQRLFKGGECGMRMVDEGDILESGIDIFAQPPGKNLQNAMLLSGGEKAMTAFAFLMALFKYRPSRFCVLDEVDGPLDDVNVTRFTKLVQEMSDRTQFIIITHNKRTMEAAQNLYGVTMEEPGVSKILSVKF